MRWPLAKNCAILKLVYVLDCVVSIPSSFTCVDGDKLYTIDITFNF